LHLVGWFMPLFALFPVLVFLTLFLRLAVSSKKSYPLRIQLAYAFVASSIVWGLLVAVSSETLSVLGGLARAPVALCWFICLILVSYKASFVDHAKIVAAGIKDYFTRLDHFEKSVVFCLAIILGLTFTVAVISPPNNADSLLYHMARVAHWEQNHNLNHFATAYDHQLFMPIWAETAILHLRILFGSDKLSNLVQWFSFFGCIFLAGSITHLIGVTRKVQILSAIFVATIPLAILEATSTQNDLVVAYWLSSLVFLILYGYKNGFDGLTTLMVGAVTALGLLTKVTFYVYALPAWLAIIFVWFSLYSRGKVLARIGVSVVLVVIMNAGYWMRNVGTYGNPIGPSDVLRSSAAFIRNQAPPIDNQSAHSENGEQGDLVAVRYLSMLLLREKRMVLWNIGVPLAPLRDRIPVVDLFLKGILDDWQYSELDQSVWNHEDTAGNPLHIILIATAIPAVALLTLRKSIGSYLPVYGMLVLISYLLLPVVISNADTLFSLRFQIPFFVLAGPLVAVVFSSIPSVRIHQLLVLSLFGLSLPWLLENNTRPILGWKPWITRTDSVFVAGNEQLIFAMKSGEEDEYQAITSAIESSDCIQIGLMLDSHDYEYLFWYLLKAPESGIEIRSVTASSESARYLDPDYSPCAVICTQCEGVSGVSGLKLREDYGYLKLFMNPKE